MKSTIIVSLVAIIPSLLFAAPPSNDSCLTPTLLTNDGTVAFDNTQATTQGPEHVTCSEQVPNDSPSISNDVWYCLTAPCSGPITIDTCGGTTVDTKLAIYEGCACPTDETNLIACDNDFCGFQSAVTFTAVAGEQYLIQLGTAAAVAGGTGSFRITCGEPQGPPCAELGLDCRTRDNWNALRSHVATTHTADSLTASDDGLITGLCWWGAYFDGQGDCQELGNDHFELRYYADDNGLPGLLLAGPFRQLSNTLMVNGPIRTYSNIMADLPEYEYHATHAPVAMAKGQCFWVYIFNRHVGLCQWYWATTRDGNGRAIVDDSAIFFPNGCEYTDLVTVDPAVCLTISIDNPPCADAPLNDVCWDSLPVTDDLTTFDTTFAQTDGNVPTACEFTVGDEQINRDIWFHYEATCTGTLRVHTCGSQFDTKLALYPIFGCPNSIAPLCSDDQCGGNPPLQSMVQRSVSIGEDYTIRVGGYDGAGGPGVLDVSCTPRPLNDECDSIDVHPLPSSWTGELANAANSCPAFTGVDVWVAFHVTEAAAVTLEYTGDDAVYVDAWRGLTASCGCDNFIFANVVQQTAGGGVQLVWDCLSPGDYYYPVVADPATAGSFEIMAVASPCMSTCMTSSADCCSAHEGTGCASSACCELICAHDPFCCAFEWDDLCAMRASAACIDCPTSPCGESTLGCLFSHDSPGCYDVEICQSICACQPHCCLDTWDQYCLEGAEEDGCTAYDYCNIVPCSQFDLDCSTLTDLQDYQTLAQCFEGPCDPDECFPFPEQAECCERIAFQGAVSLRSFRFFQIFFDQP